MFRPARSRTVHGSPHRSRKRRARFRSSRIRDPPAEPRSRAHTGVGAGDGLPARAVRGRRRRAAGLRCDGTRGGATPGLRSRTRRTSLHHAPRGGQRAGAVATDGCDEVERRASWGLGGRRARDRRRARRRTHRARRAGGSPSMRFSRASTPSSHPACERRSACKPWEHGRSELLHPLDAGSSTRPRDSHWARCERAAARTSDRGTSRQRRRRLVGGRLVRAAPAVHQARAIGHGLRQCLAEGRGEGLREGTPVHGLRDALGCPTLRCPRDARHRRVRRSGSPADRVGWPGSSRASSTPVKCGMSGFREDEIELRGLLLHRSESENAAP